MSGLERLEVLLDRVGELLDRVDTLLPEGHPPVAWSASPAFRWRVPPGRLQPVRTLSGVTLDALHGIDRQKAELLRNVRQFLQGRPANNVLLWGARGTGKSSLVKALLNALAPEGLRLVEVDKEGLASLPDVVEVLAGRPERFLVFSDDLSFAGDDPSYRALKAVLEGSVAAIPDNVLLVATSNRRHLLPEYLTENLEARNVDGEIHHGEAVEEKVSLSERFGLWLAFHPFDQETYLEIVRRWLEALGAPAGPGDEVRAEALRWALARGSRSGRTAWQFARDRAGRLPGAAGSG